MDALNPAGRTAPGPRRAVVVEECDNPSTSFFILPALAALPCPVIRRRFADLPAPGELDGALVVLVRYAPTDWVRLIEKTRHRLAGLVFFMDDDVLDTAASRGTPAHYRFKLWRLAARRRAWLAAQKVRLWVSSPHLLEKYAAWNPRLVLPVDLPTSGPPPETSGGTDVRRVFYHGTGSHNPDIRWLRPVIGSLLAARERIHFEIVGGRAVANLYKRLPRVTVVHPMPWPAYRPFASLAGRHVGLAPQLDSPFNAARSHTKFFDITRSGAVGVYAPGSACAAVVENGVDGLVVPMDPGAWVEAVARLAFDDALRSAMLENARSKARELTRLARQGHERLFEAKEPGHA